MISMLNIFEQSLILGSWVHNRVKRFGQSLLRSDKRYTITCTLILEKFYDRRIKSWKYKIWK